MNDDLTTPTYSFWPIFLAFSIVLIAIGLVSVWEISILGLLLLFVSIIGWVWENRTGTQEEGND